jgi:hypothetical protein
MGMPVAGVPVLRGHAGAVVIRAGLSCGRGLSPGAEVFGAGVPGQEAFQRRAGKGVGAENLCDQAIFVNRAPGAIAPLDPELIQIRDAVGQLP